MDFFHEGLQNSVGTGKTSEDMANLNLMRSIRAAEE